MKYSTVSIIVATFASVCSAKHTVVPPHSTPTVAPTPTVVPAPTIIASPVVATALPANFGLFIVPLEGTDPLALIPDIVTQPGSGSNLYLTKPDETEGKLPVIFVANSTSTTANAHFPVFDSYLAMKIQPRGSVVFLTDIFSAIEGEYTLEGLGSVEGGLFWDLNDGKGPQSRWGICVVQNQWKLQWAVVSQPGSACYKVDLRIREL